MMQRPVRALAVGYSKRLRANGCLVELLEATTYLLLLI